MALDYRTEYEVNTFKGLLTEFKDLREIPDGYTPDALNWLTQTNKQGIELRRGSKLLGQTRNEAENGAVTGLGVGTRFDGTEVPFFTFGQSVKYYDAVADDVADVKLEGVADFMPAIAANDTKSVFPYQNLAGAWVYISSPNSSTYKIPVANPDSAVDQLATTYRGFLKFGQSRGFLYNRHGNTPGNKDPMGLYASAVDKVDLTQYPAQVTAESIGLGNGVTVEFTYELAQITGKRTAMFVLVTDGVETFVDDRNGNLIGTLGGSGTVNYATGSITVTFNAAVVNAVPITANYYYEDSTDKGVLDFSIADPSDRQPGEGNYFPQFDGGGSIKVVFPLATVFYCLHEKKTWQVSIPVDDESGTDSISTNLPYREKMGTNSVFGATAGEQGIYLLNTADPNKPTFSRLELYAGATQANIARPTPLSDLLDLSGYATETAVVHEWGDYVLLCLAQIRNGVADTFNSSQFLLNKVTGNWDLCDNPSSALATYMGTLLSGDPLTNNVFTLFSGFDDDENLIPNYWTGGETDLNMQGQKRFTRFVVEGLIQSSQVFAVELAFDGGEFITAEYIEGDGDYVDTGKSIAVGANTVGSKINGGGSEVVYAHPFRAEFRIQSARFQYVRPRFQALNGGYLSINKYSYKDIRQKSLKSMPERIINL